MSRAAATATTKKSEETRIRILEAALLLFRKRGFEKTTMRDIARESGVALGAAYYYFDSKDALVMAFYERAQRDLDPLLEEALAKHAGAGRTVAGGHRSEVPVLCSQSKTDGSAVRAY